MARTKECTSRPAMTPETREKQIISAAYDLAEKQIKEGTASATVIAHFLRLGSQRERLERELLNERTLLASAKRESIDREKEQDEKYDRVMNALKRYHGEFIDEDDGLPDAY